MSILSLARSPRLTHSLLPLPLTTKPPTTTLLLATTNNKTHPTPLPPHRTYTCTHPQPPTTDPKWHTHILTSCQNAAVRTHAAAAHDALITAIQKDMIREIDLYMAANPEAVKGITRLGPALEGLKGALRGEGEWQEAWGQFYKMTSYGKMGEWVKGVDGVEGRLWEGRREVGNVVGRKGGWCGGWCGDGVCVNSPGEGEGGVEGGVVKEGEEDQKLGDQKLEDQELEDQKLEDQKLEDQEVEAQEVETQAPEDDKSDPKAQALRLVSRQLRANQLLAQQVQSQKQELDDQKLKIQKLERRLQEVEDEISEDDEDKKSTPLATKNDISDEQLRAEEDALQYESRDEFFQRADGKV
ncbi:MAG: hypothetical protein Q9195_000828 [Heterodermia aff. obscurata]